MPDAANFVAAWPRQCQRYLRYPTPPLEAPPALGTVFVTHFPGPGAAAQRCRSGPGLPDRFRTSLPDQPFRMRTMQNVPAVQNFQLPPLAA